MENFSVDFKENYLNIFNYLYEFSKIRDRTVRNIETANNYLEILWLEDIPENKYCENILNKNFNKENNYWIKIKKPIEPQHPKFKISISNLQNWIEYSSLFDEKNGPQLKPFIDNFGEKIYLEDNPKILEAFQKYINYYWEEDLKKYKKAKKAYNEEYKIYEIVNNIYTQLFRIYNKIEKFGEELELIIGVGLFCFKKDNNCPTIFRHVITQKVNIEFNFTKNNSEIKISPIFEDSIKFEYDFIFDLNIYFDPHNINSAENEAIKKLNKYEEKNGDISVFDEDFHEIIQIFSDRLSPESIYLKDKNKPNKIFNKPIISFSPALILRKRSIKNLTNIYERIIEELNNYSPKEIPILNSLIGKPIKFKEEPILRKFFPLEYNEEQEKILENAYKYDKILVQGPPGTGKTHTIANLICHFLSEGKKILVTAYTMRALNVLKEKLPKEFRSLVVSYLSGETYSLNDLHLSIKTIIDLKYTDLNKLIEEIDLLYKKLDNINKEIALKINEFNKIKEKLIKKFNINSNYNGSLLEICEIINNDKKKFSWYRDNYSDINDRDLIQNLSHFFNLNKKYKNLNVKKFKYNIIQPENLLPPDKINEYLKLKELLSQSEEKSLELYKLNNINFDELEKKLNKLLHICKKIKNYHIINKEKILQSYLKNEGNIWEIKLHRSLEIIKKLEKFDLLNIDRNIEIKYNTSKSLKQLKNDAEFLLKYLQNGKRLSKISIIFSKIFKSKEFNEKLYFPDEVFINGSPCDTREELEIVKNDLTIKLYFNELCNLLEIENNNKFYYDKFIIFKQVYYNMEKFIQLLIEAEKLKNEIQKITNDTIIINSFDLDFIKNFLTIVDYNNLYSKINSVKKDINSTLNLLLRIRNPHPIINLIIKALKEYNYVEYKELYDKLYQLNKEKTEYLKFQNLKQDLLKKIPNIIKDIEKETFPEENIFELKNAIYFKHALQEIKKLTNPEYEEKLLKTIKALEKNKKEIIRELAIKKTYKNIIINLKENTSLINHLEAWLLAVKKIGKTGKGKKAKKFKITAQKEMNYCKEAVPCWIMPLYKVTETITPRPELFDYVIIDEASQLGPEALFLLYITKKIIIVGDDKQTSPEYVGIDANIMEPLIKKYLKDIPNSDFYRPGCSLYELASTFYKEKIVLKEHFRCMPEIIEFSNKYFYAPEGNSLYPLKQYSENRLKPLKTVYCPDGYIEGSHSRIINRPEAEKIVKTISSLIKRPEYENKSFGIISLQGKSQAILIEKLLLEEIGEKEFKKRNIKCDDAFSFQGDERDIIFLSLVTAHNHKRQSLTSTNDERRFNVAASRAKEQSWLFHSVQLEDLNKIDLRYKLLDHYLNYSNPNKIWDKLIKIPPNKKEEKLPKPFESWFEVEVYNEIILKGYKVIPQYRISGGKYRIDLAIVLKNGNKIAVECDGDKWHNAENYEKDISRQKDLERCGWQFFRIRSYEYYINKENVLEKLWKFIKNNESQNFNNTKKMEDKKEVDIPIKNENLIFSCNINNIGVIKVIQYSNKSIAVFGKTIAIKEQLKSIGGKYNPYLKLNDKKIGGWIFINKMKDKVVNLLKELSREYYKS